MSDAKLIRGQLRQVAKELLPEFIAHEVHIAHYNALKSEIQGQLSVLEKQVKETLTAIDNRSKEIQLFMMKQFTANQTLPKEVTGEVSEAVQKIIDKTSE